MKMRALLLLVACGPGALGCVEGPALSTNPLPLTRITTDRTYLRDGHGRYLYLHGVNVSGSTKAPEIDLNGEPLYLRRPFPLEEADAQFEKIRQMGFGAVRLLLMWEAIEPRAKGEYDQKYLDFVREITKRAGDHGLYVLLDMHQDIFSRHLYVKYNSRPENAPPGSIERQLLGLVQPYNDKVVGDGAPRWAVAACLPEKVMDSPYWGIPRLVSGLTQEALLNVVRIYQKLTGQTDSGAPPPEWAVRFAALLPDQFPVNETTDLLPFTHWGTAHALSLDVARCYACFFAGDKVFPTLKRDGMSVKDWLQEAYANSWRQVALKVRDLPNVLGYDLMNEPSGNYLVLTAIGGLLKAGVTTGARDALISLLGFETGTELYQALLDLRILPPDVQPETLRLWGLDLFDPLAALGLNWGFSDTYLRPFYERVGEAIQEVDPNAVFFIEDAISPATVLGGVFGGLGGIWEIPLTRPRGLKQVVFAPHWYADIYPFLGINQAPRRFSVEEVRFRDYQPKLEEIRRAASYSLGNIPVVFGEFGTYFNFNGIEQSVRDGYSVSAAFLNNYYEAFERMFQSNMIWCYSKENDAFFGDGWNHEDFSILDPDERPRGHLAWMRPHARALAGKPVSTYFNSDFHYYDPDKGVPVPRRWFEVRYASQETRAPTELWIPRVQYPDGFYVWVSDGACTWDEATQTLYHYPSVDEPGFVHFVQVRPPQAGQENIDWDYFVKDGHIVGGP
jgi:hypothetical protein